MQAFVYLFGSLFVLFVVVLSRTTIQDVVDATREVDEQKRIEQNLHNAKVAAEAANQAKSDFLANMSHELRTPLNSIIGFTEILSDQAMGPITPEQGENLHIIHKESHRLLDLINRILDLSQVETGKLNLHIESIPVKPLVENACSLVADEVAAKKITLNRNFSPGLEVIRANRSKLGLIIDNILGNAIKFTPEGGCIGVLTQKEGARVIFTISDSGIGITPQDLPKLFQPFQQLESPMIKSFQGSGLGLYLSRRLVELMGGQMWVKSEAGKGSKFSFSIPLT